MDEASVHQDRHFAHGGRGHGLLQAGASMGQPRVARFLEVLADGGHHQADGLGRIRWLRRLLGPCRRARGPLSHDAVDLRGHETHRAGLHCPLPLHCAVPHGPVPSAGPDVVDLGNHGHLHALHDLGLPPLAAARGIHLYVLPYRGVFPDQSGRLGGHAARHALPAPGLRHRQTGPVVLLRHWSLRPDAPDLQGLRELPLSDPQWPGRFWTF
mmetsp:Transcript_26337/g.73633  ORF Transcript_26337/g.73633 Transcript_26337/m.73633 type:complete len:212 (+) Transcript_26337:322-957(+)